MINKNMLGEKKTKIFLQLKMLQDASRSQAQWHPSIISAAEKQRQEDEKFKANLGYMRQSQKWNKMNK